MYSPVDHNRRNRMQITSVKKEELALLIHGLRSMCVVDQINLQKRLLEQLEHELSTRYGVKLLEPTA
jgi:hypothetical protein